MITTEFWLMKAETARKLADETTWGVVHRRRSARVFSSAGFLADETTWPFVSAAQARRTLSSARKLADETTCSDARCGRSQCHPGRA
jgi:hypothetical protein